MREVPLATSTYDTLTERNSPLPLDSPFIRQTKDRIRDIVAQITKVSQSAIEPSDFWNFALPCILEAMGGDGAGIWAWRPNEGWILVAHSRLAKQLLDDDTVNSEMGQSDTGQSDTTARFELNDASFDRLDGIEKQLSAALVSSSSLSSTDFASRLPDEVEPSSESSIPSRQPSETHLQLLNEVRKERQPVLISPQSAIPLPGRPANPTECLLMMVPLPIALDGGELWLELLQQPSGGPASQRGYLRFAAQMADILAEYLRSFRLRTLERDQEFMRRSYETIDLAASAPDTDRGLSNLISDIRNASDAEHAILFRRRGGRHRWRVAAIAGLPKVDRRADGVHLLEESAPHLDMQLKNGPALHRDYAGIGSDEEPANPPEFERWRGTFTITRLLWIKPLLVNVSTTTSCATLLDEILAPREVSSNENSDLRAHDTAILLTWSGRGIPPVRCVEQSALTLKLGLSILRPRWWQHHVIDDARLHPSQSGVGSSRKWFAAIMFALIATAIMAIPVPMQIESTATLRPSKGTELFASADGVIEEVLVKHGQSVNAGDPLVRIDSPKLRADYDEAKVKLEKSIEKLEELRQSLLNNRALTKAERDSIALEFDALQKIQQIETNALTRFEREIERLTIRAKSAGIVETWRVEESLDRRPVRMGQWLFSIRQHDSEWELQAAIPERYLQELRKASGDITTSTIARMTSLPTKQLRLRLSDPITWRPIASRTPSVNDSLDDRQYLVRLTLEDSLPASVAVTGASARVAITTGNGPLVWALSKDFIEDIGVRTAMWLQ